MSRATDMDSKEYKDHLGFCLLKSTFLIRVLGLAREILHVSKPQVILLLLVRGPDVSPSLSIPDSTSKSLPGNLSSLS